MKKWQKILSVVGIGVLSCAIGVGVTIPVVTEKIYDSTLIGSYQFLGQTEAICTQRGEDHLFYTYDKEQNIDIQGTYEIQDTVMKCYDDKHDFVGSIIYSYGKYYWAEKDREPREIAKVSDVALVFGDTESQISVTNKE